MGYEIHVVVFVMVLPLQVGSGPYFSVLCWYFLRKYDVCVGRRLLPYGPRMPSPPLKVGVELTARLSQSGV